MKPIMKVRHPLMWTFLKIPRLIWLKKWTQCSAILVLIGEEAFLWSPATVVLSMPRMLKSVLVSILTYLSHSNIYKQILNFKNL